MERVAATREPRVLRLFGPAGSGKTWVLRKATSAARDLGWLAVVVAVPANSDADPSALLVDLLSAIIRELKESAAAYVSGLNSALSILRPGRSVDLIGEAAEAVDHEIVVSRLLEGIAADRPIVVTIDDAQVVAGESARALRYIYKYLNGQPFCLILAQRDDVVVHPDFPSGNIDVVLGPLTDGEARAIVRHEYPDAAEDVLTAIVARTHGIPAEVVLLAAQARADGAEAAADVSASIAAKVASDLQRLDEEQRTFLHLCALLDGTIEEYVLATLYPQPEVLARIVESQRRFIVARGGAISFRHELFAAGIRDTIALQLPLRRRILEALIACDRGGVSDWERIVAHAEKLGDRETGHRYSVRIAEAAYLARNWERAATAFESALAFGWPEPELYIVFFRRYATALRAALRDVEAEMLIVRAIRHGREIAIVDGLGRLGGTLVALQTELEEYDRAVATYERALTETTDAVELSELHAAVSMTFANMSDDAAFSRVAEKMRAATVNSSLAMASLHQSQAILDAWLGRPQAARSALEIARSYAAEQQSGLDFSLPLIELLTGLQDHGCGVFDDLIADGEHTSHGAEIVGYWHYYHAVADLARGRWGAVQTRLEQLNLDRLPRVVRMLLYGVGAAMAALATPGARMPPGALELLEAESRRGLGPSGFQLAAWTLAGRHAPPILARELARQIEALRSRPLAVDLFCFVPVALSLYAVENDRDLVVELADEDSPPCSRWMRAQYLFRRGYSAAALGRENAVPTLRDAAAAFSELGATFFASLAEANAIAAETPGSAAVHVPAVNKNAPKSATERNGRDILTARELEISALVAQGLRNREIAHALFLSERTVEVHVSHIFAKLNLTSRTQLVRYMSA